MQIGLFANHQAPKEDDVRDLIDGTFRMIRTADRVGFDHVSTGQHFLSDFTQPQLFPYLSRVTAEVESLDVSTGVAVLPLQHPVDVAERIATISQMHDGDTYLGVGAGYRDVEFDSFGVPKSERGKRIAEGVRLVDRLLSEENVSFDGDIYSVDDVTLSLKPAGEIPIWIAANSDAAVRRAARISDGWFVSPHSTIAEVETQKREVYDPIRDERGEPATVPIIRECFVAETTEAAVETSREYLEQKYERYVEWGQHEAMEDSAELKQQFEALAEDRFVLGTPAEVCEELERYEERLDVDLALLRLNWPGLPYDRACECIELIGDEVVPNV